MKRFLCTLALCGMFATSASAIDVWDLSSEDDNGAHTDNVLTHGVAQVHDLAAEAGVADEDWYRIVVAAYSSVEVVVDGLTGDLTGLDPLSVTRRSSSGTLLQTSVGHLGDSRARRLAWHNETANNEVHYVRVGGAGCGSGCGSSDQYTIRMRETQVALARFNNTGTQVTVMLVQNPSNVAISGKVYFWSSFGSLLGTYSFINLLPKMLAVIQTQNYVAGQSGSATIAHDGPHFGINAKAVALEPATGFSFDTPGVIRP